MSSDKGKAPVRRNPPRKVNVQAHSAEMFCRRRLREPKRQIPSLWRHQGADIPIGDASEIFGDKEKWASASVKLDPLAVIGKVFDSSPTKKHIHVVIEIAT
ncbi:7569_t:CDS:2, partial [Paraglomus brasilianum]